VLPGAINVPRAIHIYRVTLPFSKINDHTKNKLGWVGSEAAAVNLNRNEMNAMLDSDIIVLARPITNDQHIADSYCALMKSRGALLVYETDDDLTNTYRDTSSGNVGATCLPFIRHCDAVTVSTEPLKQLLQNFSNRPIFVLPNKIDHTFFAKRLQGYQRKYKDTLNIMLAGTKTHGEDWRYAADAARLILAEYPNTRLLVGGFHPDYIGAADRVELLPFMPYHAYPTMLAETDIVIAAIDPNDGFNQCKSAVKALEAWAAVRPVGNRSVGGAAVIATDSVVYSNTVSHESNGLLVEHSVEGYHEALKRLIEEPSLRVSLQRRGYLDVIKRHGIYNGWSAWLSAYHAIRRLKP
jgi:glycosyltransferase involved in cell wall biosynthesis